MSARLCLASVLTSGWESPEVPRGILGLACSPRQGHPLSTQSYHADYHFPGLCSPALYKRSSQKRHDPSTPTRSQQVTDKGPQL